MRYIPLKYICILYCTYSICAQKNPKKEEEYVPLLTTLLADGGEWILAAAASTYVPPPYKSCVNITATAVREQAECIVSNVNLTIRLVPMVRILGLNQAGVTEIRTMAPINEYTIKRRTEANEKDPIKKEIMEREMDWEAAVNQPLCWQVGHWPRRFYRYRYIITPINKNRDVIYIVGVKDRFPSPAYEVGILTKKLMHRKQRFVTNMLKIMDISDLLRKFEKQMGFQTDIKWSMIMSISAYHALAIYWTYLYAFPAKWQTLVFAWVMYVISGSGLAQGVHRYWTHKSYKATLPLKIYLMLCFASAGQNSIYSWVRDHRVHHKYSDTDADPHNIRRGFFYAHIGWLMMKKNNLVLEKGRQIDMSDIEKDSVAMFERKYSFPLSIIFCFFLPTVTGVLLWGETWQCAVAWQCFIRYLIILHLEMSVNSFLHLFGTRPYNKYIMPTQNIFMSFMTVGEGCHNYHHTYPSDYRSAEPLDFLNISTFVIRLWAKLGIAYDLKESGSRQLMKQKINEKNSED